MARTLFPRALAVIVLLGALPAVAQDAERALTVCAEDVPDAFDPAAAIARAAIPLGPAQIFDRLVNIGPDGLTVDPRLARWWDISRDGREYTFKLRRGVSFHQTPGFAPTRPLGAADVAFTFQRLIDAAHPFAPAQDAHSYPRMLGLGALVTGVEAVEDDLVRFTLSRADNAFLSMLAMEFASIQSAEYAATLERAAEPARRLGEAPVGTGPFRLDAAGEGTVHLGANERYWDGPPATATLTLAAISSATSRFAALGDGSCAVVVSPDPLDIDTLASQGTARIEHLADDGVVYLAFNTARPALAQAATRRRLAGAIDRAALAAKLAANTIAADRLTPPHSAGAPAPELNGFGTSGSLADVALTLLTVTQDEGGTPDALALELARTWRTLGAEVTLDAVAWPDYAAALAKGDYDAAIVGFEPDTPDDALTLLALLGCAARGTTNLANWCEPEFDAAIGEARSAGDPVRRAGALERAHAIAAREMPAYPLIRPTVTVAISPEIEGLDAAALAKGDFRAARITDNRNARQSSP